MAKKKGGGRSKTKPKRTRGQKAVVHLTDILVIAWILERMGILDGSTIQFILSGNFQSAIATVQMRIKENFSGGGVAMTVASGISLAVLLKLLRMALKGHTVSLKSPKALAV